MSIFRNRRGSRTGAVAIAGAALGATLATSGCSGTPPTPAGEGCGPVPTNPNNYINKEQGPAAARALNRLQEPPSQVTAKTGQFNETANDKLIKDNFKTTDDVLNNADLVAKGQVKSIFYKATGIEVTFTVTEIYANNNTTATVGQTVKVCFPHLPAMGHGGVPYVKRDPRFPMPPDLKQEAVFVLLDRQLVPVIGSLALDPGGTIVPQSDVYPVYFYPVMGSLGGNSVYKNGSYSGYRVTRTFDPDDELEQADENQGQRAATKSGSSNTQSISDDGEGSSEKDNLGRSQSGTGSQPGDDEENENELGNGSYGGSVEEEPEEQAPVEEPVEEPPPIEPEGLGRTQFQFLASGRRVIVREPAVAGSFGL
jgi:hypothetical protein